METLLANLSRRTRRETLHDHPSLVAPLTLIVPGVLDGSMGPLYYPVDEVLHDARNHSNNLNNVALQCLQNAVENANFKAKNILDTANLINKQAAAHRDIAIDREWNIDEVAGLSSTLIRDLSGTNVMKEAVEAAVAAALAKAVNPAPK